MIQPLEKAALRWLAWEKKCMAVLFERNPRYTGGVPDALGITQARYMIEVEVKRSVSDFKANAEKRHVQNRPHFLERWPKQFYFLVPDEIAVRASLLVPEWAGLAKLVDTYKFVVVKQAPVNTASKRLTTRECVKLFHLLSNQLTSCGSTHDGATDFRRGHEDWYQFGEIFYGINYMI